MDPWPSFIAAVLDRHGVADVDLARSYGIGERRFYGRTRREGWHAPAPRVRVHPEAKPSVQARLLVVCRATGRLAAASNHVAAWLHGLERYPPKRLTVVGDYQTSFRRHTRVTTARCRWLRDEDISEVGAVPTLAPAALLLASGRVANDRRWTWLIDAIHRGMVTPEAILERIGGVGPVPGSAWLRRACRGLVGSRVESVFQYRVATELHHLGYGPSFDTLQVPTPDGVGLTIDVPLTAWQVAVEPDGDAFHRTREQRRLDRRREAAFASIDWARVPVDWRDWHADQEHVLAAIDAAIMAQRRRGIGAGVPPPVRAPAAGGVHGRAA